MAEGEAEGAIIEGAGGDAGNAGGADGGAGAEAGQGGEGAAAGGAGADDGGSDGGTDWRSELAGEDKDLLGFLGRYHSRDAALKAFKQTNDDIKQGKYIQPLGDEATEDELKTYRSMFGIPEAPEGYNEALPEGMVIGDDDKPNVGKFMEAMHGANAPPAAVAAALDTYFGFVEEQEASQAQVIRDAEGAGEEALRAEWGADYKPNLNAMHSYLDTLPEPVQNVFKNALLPDESGQLVPVGYNPEALKWLTSLALEANPASTLVPGHGGDQGSAIADEIASIEKMMGDHSSDYWKGPKSEGLQQRYRDLTTAQEKLHARG